MDFEARTSFSVKDQRIIIKFLFVSDDNAKEIHRKLVDIFGRDALSERTVRYWCQRFRDRNFDVEEQRGGDHRTGPETAERIRVIEEAFEQSRAWTLMSLSAKFGIPYGTCQRIVTEKLGMTKKNAKWVPHELTPGQMEVRVVYSKFNLQQYNQQKTRLEHTVAIDETWVSFNRPPERDQARQWLREGERPMSVAVLNRYGPKVMMVLAMDIHGICYYEILDKNEKMSATRYLEFLKRLMDRWRGSRKHTVWLLDDNARPHRTAPITQWIEENRIERWHQPPYSPDLSPCDFGCFHALKRAIGGVRYANIDSLKTAVDDQIIIGNANDAYTAVQRLPERWLQCANNKGEYL